MPSDPERPDTSRRALLRTAAALSAGAVATGCDFSYYSRDAGDGGGLDAAPDVVPEAGADADNGDPAADIDGLNALLGLEYTLVLAYTALAPILLAPPAGDPLGALGPTLAQLATRWLGHHQAHAAALAAAITDAGGTPILQSSITFTPPATFTPSVANVLKAAANAEKGAAVQYGHHVAQLGVAPHRFLAGAIAGDETQHFIVLYVVLQGSAAPGPAFASMLAQIVPTPFVSTVVGNDGLQTVADLPFT